MSELQRDVARVLRALGVPAEVEALTADGLFSVDIALAGAGIGSAFPLALLAHDLCAETCLLHLSVRCPFKAKLALVNIFTGLTIVV